MKHRDLFLYSLVCSIYNTLLYRVPGYLLFCKALDLIATTKEVLRTELQGLHCLRHMGSQLTEMHKVVVVMLEQAFNSIALEDFRAKL